MNISELLARNARKYPHQEAVVEQDRGAPLGTNEVQRIQQKFKTKNLMCVYGLTEAGPNGTLLEAEEHLTKAGRIGRRAALNCELRIVDDSGRE